MSMAGRKLRFAGFQTIRLGVDSGASPYAVPPEQLSWLVNGHTRQQAPQCRPGRDQLTLTYKLDDGSVDTTTQTRFESGGRFQGAAAYEADSGELSLVASIGGRLFKTTLDSTFTTVELTGSDINQVDTEQAWFVQAENYLIVQNGADLPFIWDGATLRRSLPAAKGGNEVPTGQCMAYNNGRIWVALPPNGNKGQSFVAGDLAYSVTGSRADVLTFTENTFLAGGGEFAVPTQAGRIRAMVSVALQDSTTGQGPLQVFTDRAAFSVNAPFDREAWQSTTSPIQTISLLAAGAASQASAINVNGDIWFRSLDGVRSFVIARRDHGTWVNTPLSHEMERAFSRDGLELLRFASAALWDNRWVCTTAPYIVGGESGVRGIAHQGVAVLDFNPVTSMFERTNPVWEGVWSGMPVLQVVQAGGRLFYYALDEDDKVTLWEQSLTARFDNGDTRIAWALETPAYGFDTDGWSLRELDFGDIWLDRMAGDLGFTLRYREDSYPFWRTWYTWTDCASIDGCDKEACEVPLSSQEQYRARKLLPSPLEACDAVAGKPAGHLYRCQLRLEVVGSCRVRQLRLIARDVPEVVSGSC